jgi:hypothetical protein
MNVQQAQRILARHKEGDVYPQWVINTALYLTGDIDEMPLMPSPHRGGDQQDKTSELHLQKKDLF